MRNYMRCFSQVSGVCVSNLGSSKRRNGGGGSRRGNLQTLCSPAKEPCQCKVTRAREIQRETVNGTFLARLSETCPC